MVYSTYNHGWWRHSGAGNYLLFEGEQSSYHRFHTSLYTPWASSLLQVTMDLSSHSPCHSTELFPSLRRTRRRRRRRLLMVRLMCGGYKMRETLRRDGNCCGVVIAPFIKKLCFLSTVRDSNIHIIIYYIYYIWFDFPFTLWLYLYKSKGNSKCSFCSDGEAHICAISLSDNIIVVLKFSISIIKNIRKLKKYVIRK